jgi:hypothetical protein
VSVPQDLVRGLFGSAGVRLGWQFRPSAMLEAPKDDPAPAWREPGYLSEIARQRTFGLVKCPVYAAGVGGIAWGTLSLPALGAVAVNAVLASGLLVAGLAFVLVRQIRNPREQWRWAVDERNKAHAAHQQQEDQWNQRRREYEDKLHRLNASAQWFPLSPQAAACRVDVFGGTGDSWASLITTMGSSLLAAGSNVLVADFSDEYVARELCAFTAAAGFPVTNLGVTHDTRGALLQGLSYQDASEIIAEAAATLRSPTEPAEKRILDAYVLTTIGACLDTAEPVTFARLAAAVRVACGHYDPKSGDGPLTKEEVGRLIRKIDILRRADNVSNALPVLINLLELLATDSTEPEQTGPDLPAGSMGWSAPGLTVLATRGTHDRRKDFLDRVLFHRILHELRVREPCQGRDVLFMVGVDRIGLASLEALSKQARGAGVRLVLMMEHLRDDLTHLVGSADSSTILMRMGNHTDANAAAEFIGRGYTFQASQITKQVGSSFTEGYSEGISIQTSTSVNVGAHTNTPKSANWWDWKAGSTGSSNGTAWVPFGLVATDGQLLEHRLRLDQYDQFPSL